LIFIHNQKCYDSNTVVLNVALLADFGKLFTRGIKFQWAYVRRLYYYTGSYRKVMKIYIIDYNYNSMAVATKFNFTRTIAKKHNQQNRVDDLIKLLTMYVYQLIWIFLLIQTHHTNIFNHFFIWQLATTMPKNARDMRV
jgi:hypothetical protein